MADLVLEKSRRPASQVHSLRMLMAKLARAIDALG